MCPQIKRLKAALREGGSDVCPEEMQQLKQQLENSRIKLKRSFLLLHLLYVFFFAFDVMS